MRPFQFIKAAYPFGSTIVISGGLFQHARFRGPIGPQYDEFSGVVSGCSRRLLDAVMTLKPHEEFQ